MNVEDKIADAKKREEKENEINRQPISNAIAELLGNFKYKHGKIAIRKDKDSGNKFIVIAVITRYWSENESAVKKFNNTRVKSATINWWMQNPFPDSPVYYYKWEIPLYLVDEAILEAVKK